MSLNFCEHLLCRGILHSDLVKEFRSETHFLRRMRHPNVILFMGTCTNIKKNDLCIVTGTVLHNSSVNQLNVKLIYKIQSLCQGETYGMCSMIRTQI